MRPESPEIVHAIRMRADLVGAEVLTDAMVLGHYWDVWRDYPNSEDLILDAANRCREVLEMEPINAP